MAAVAFGITLCLTNADAAPRGVGAGGRGAGPRPGVGVGGVGAGAARVATPAGVGHVGGVRVGAVGVAGVGAGARGVGVAPGVGVGAPGPAVLPAGYCRAVPAGYATVAYAGATCRYAGGVYYRPATYQGQTVWIVVP